MKLLENNAVFYDICLVITVYSVDLYLSLNSTFICIREQEANNYGMILDLLLE